MDLVEGAVDPQGGYVSKILHVKTKESGPIGGSRGCTQHVPPYGSRFFHFDMQNFQNVAASGVHGPPYEVHAPLWEILDPPLGPVGGARAGHVPPRSANAIDDGVNTGQKINGKYQRITYL